MARRRWPKNNQAEGDSVDDIMMLGGLVEGLAEHFGKRCEFVLHDCTKDDGEGTIVKILNGDVTGRKEGQNASGLGLRIVEGYENENGHFNQITQTQDGRFLRSSTIYIKNGEGKKIGTLCVNFDITELLISRNFLDGFINLGQENEKTVQGLMFERVEDLLIHLITESITYVGTPVALMTREQKVDGINFLKKKGAFKIKNAGNVIAKYYDISKYTIYNYLNEIEEAEKR